MSSQLHVRVSDPDVVGLEGFVVVDSLVGGRALGGTRMTPTVTIDEVALLARRMTDKLALAGVPIGGAKAGIRCGLPAGPERNQCLARFGEAVAPLLHGGIYLGSDQGISHRDRDAFFAAAGYDVRTQLDPSSLSCTWTEIWDRCEDITGFGVCEGIAAATEIFAPRGGFSRAVIQGFGAVGRAVAKSLAGRGLAVVGVADRHGTITRAEGLPLDKLLAATDAFGTIDRARLPGHLCIDPSPEAWLRLDTDLLVLAAGGAAIRADNVDSIQAALLVEGANLACTAAAEQILAKRGIPVLPDVVVNCGGAAVSGLIITGETPAGLDPDGLASWLHRAVAGTIRTNVTALLSRVSGQDTLGEIAANMAADAKAGFARLDASGIAKRGTAAA